MILLSHIEAGDQERGPESPPTAKHASSPARLMDLILPALVASLCGGILLFALWLRAVAVHEGETASQLNATVSIQSLAALSEAAGDGDVLRRLVELWSEANLEATTIRILDLEQQSVVASTLRSDGVRQLTRDPDAAEKPLIELGARLAGAVAMNVQAAAPLHGLTVRIVAIILLSLIAYLLITSGIARWSAARVESELRKDIPEA
jgi:hypothetical protein